MEGAMGISYRLPLADTTVLNQPVPVALLADTFYSWQPDKRLFVIARDGDVFEKHDVHRRAVAMRITLKQDSGLPAVSEMVPPVQLLERIAWDYGFPQTIRRSLPEARARLIPLRDERVSNRVFIVRRDIVFAYNKPELNGAELDPLVWAATHKVHARDINAVLSQHFKP